MADRLECLPGPELFFGLVGPVGTQLDIVVGALKTELTAVGYTVVEVQVSDLLCHVKAFANNAGRTFPSDFDRISELMTAGSTLRRDLKRGDALALLTVAEIRQLRSEGNKKRDAGMDEETAARTPLERTAYIFRSLKNPAEIATLRDIYGRAFFLVSAYSPRNARVRHLSRRIAESVRSTDADSFRSQAEELVTRDESEGDKLGQNVRDCFPLADLFVDIGNSPAGPQASVKRFIEALFGHPFHTPSRDEFAMFHAFASALRSADLSRQVGAAIATDDGQILAVGCNEVPKYGGGHYWPEDGHDARDFVAGFDSGARARVSMVAEVLDRLQQAGLVTGGPATIRALAEDLTIGARKDVLRGSQVVSVIEFGRSVHAEMAAITDAARRGVAIQGATLYCTTFPCHLCARHIIGAGLKRVVYIEPYPKSAAEDLYQDSMVVDAEGQLADHVSFDPFVGVAPSVYPFMFRVEDIRKKSDGSASKWGQDLKREPRLRRFVLSYMTIEEAVLGRVIPVTFVGEYAII